MMEIYEKYRKKNSDGKKFRNGEKQFSFILKFNITSIFNSKD